MSTKLKGDKYELSITNYVNQLENREVFLWKNIPEKYLLEINLIHNLNEHRFRR